MHREVDRKDLLDRNFVLAHSHLSQRYRNKYKPSPVLCIEDPFTTYSQYKKKHLKSKRKFTASVFHLTYYHSEVGDAQSRGITCRVALSHTYCLRRETLPVTNHIAIAKYFKRKCWQ